MRERIARRYAVVFGVLLGLLTLTADLAVQPPSWLEAADDPAKVVLVSPAPPTP